MKKIRSLAIASLFVLSVASTQATTITENFTNNPALDGWQAFGDTNLFTWDSTNHNLAVTWDASLTTTGVDGMLILPDTNSLADKAFYRVRAGRP